MKPWDKLRKATIQPPIGQGTFDLRNGFLIEVDYLSPTNHTISLRLGRGSHACAWNSAVLRQLADFATELANQLESNTKDNQ